MEDYDEFGNYIGADSDSDLSGGEEEEEVGYSREAQAAEEDVQMGEHAGGVDGELGNDQDADLGEPVVNARNQIVLHEDKKYYPTAEETYGRDVETLVQEEDTQPLSEPIVQPIKVRQFNIEEKGLPVTRFDRR